MVMLPYVLLLYRIILTILFFFSYEVEYCSFEVFEELCCDFDGVCTESVDCFFKIGRFTMLILYIQKHGRSFHFLISSSIFFVKDILLYRFLSCFIRFSPRYFICGYCKGRCFFDFFLGHLSFLCRKATDFFYVILYPDTLLKVFISYRSSLVEFLGSVRFNIISSENNEILTSFLYPLGFLLLSCCSSFEF